MRAVSRFNEDSGGRPAPEARAELWTLIDRLAGPPDFWDRPDGDFGSLTRLYGLDVEERERANSLYRLGSKALGRGELPAAADWLGEAASAGHPGALFRLALVVLRARAGSADDAWFLVDEAARHGHGDAKRLLAAAGRPLPLHQCTGAARGPVLLRGAPRPAGYAPPPASAGPAPGPARSRAAARHRSGGLLGRRATRRGRAAGRDRTRSRSRPRTAHPVRTRPAPSLGDGYRSAPADRPRRMDWPCPCPT